MNDVAGKRPVALVVTRNFPPLVGGMERVCLHLVRALQTDYSVELVGPAGASAFTDVKVHETRLVPLAVFLLVSAAKAAWRSLVARPRLVVAGSGLGSPIAIICATLAQCRSVTYLHGLDIVAPSRLYQLFWLPFIRRSDIVFANSRNTRRLAIEHGVPGDRIRILNPGTTIPRPTADAGEAFRAAHSLGSRPILLSVGRFTPRKGLAEFIVLSLPQIVAHVPEAILVVIGGEPRDALHGGGGRETSRIEHAIAEGGLEESVRLVGRLTDENLASAYRAAACHVFPVLDLPGDAEGFGMVAIESASHGVPTVAFDVGGVADAVREDVSGFLVKAGNYDEFAEKVFTCLSDSAPSRESCSAFARSKEWAIFEAAFLAEIDPHPNQPGRRISG